MNSKPKKTILVVDDTPENLRLLSEMLSGKGYRVRSAPNGQHALISVQKELPDLILLDIMMPGMDGYEVCHQLKANPHTQEIPVIFISALDEVLDKMTAFSIGGVDYITKPFQVEEVLARVHTHLTLQDMRQSLQEKNNQLQLQNAELDAFAHTVAHDLKNPLSKIIGSLSVLQMYAEPLLADSELLDVLHISMRTSKKMVSIIDELLLLAGVRKENVQAVPLKMANIVSQTQNRLSHMIDAHKARITTPDDWPVVLGYGPWIEEVWANYISNGLKYGGRPPHLELGFTPQVNGQVRFWVKDNGPGINPEQQAILFTEFTRLSQIRVEGHGLGLSIVQRIMTKLGGQVGVESEPGQGSLFYFTLPMPETI